MVSTLLHMEEVQSFIFEEERDVSRNGLLFDDMCVSECQSTLLTYDVVTDEVRYNNRYLCFVSHNLLQSLYTAAVPHANAPQYIGAILRNFITFFYKVRRKLHTHTHIYI